MKKSLILLLSSLLIIAFSACNNYGKKKVFDGVEVYHTENVTDAEADALGNYLVADKFADGNPKTVQLAKSGNTYQFRMVIKDGYDKKPEYAKLAKFMATMLSAKLFNGAPVEMHLCDDQLKTLKVLVADDYGKLQTFDGVDVYHSRDLTDAEVSALGKYLQTSGFANGKEKSVLLTKNGSTYQFRFVVRSGIEKDTDYLKNSAIFASDLSSKVFNNSATEVILCDEYFNPVATVPMK